MERKTYKGRTAADKLRANLDETVYKHAVLGLIFLKYVSDSFDLRKREVEAKLRDYGDDYYLYPADCDFEDAYPEEIAAELEVRDYYFEENVFRVLARWNIIQESVPLSAGTELTVANGKKKKYKIMSIGKLVDDALGEIEKENPKLKRVPNKNYTQQQLPAESLINLIAEILFQHRSLDAKDSMSRNTKGAGEIRETIIESSLVECSATFFDPASEVLLIGARKLGFMVDRVIRAFICEDNQRVVSVFHECQRDKGAFTDIPCFSKITTLDENAEHGFILTLNRYIVVEGCQANG